MQKLKMMRKISKLLRKLRMRGGKLTRPSEQFSIDEHKGHFEKV